MVRVVVADLTIWAICSVSMLHRRAASDDGFVLVTAARSSNVRGLEGEGGAGATAGIYVLKQMKNPKVYAYVMRSAFYEDLGVFPSTFKNHFAWDPSRTFSIAV